MRQYWSAKQAHPDCVVLFRMGDFFEMFGDDAERAAPLLGVALTARPFGRAGRVPMCGVPHHSVEPYARKLLDAGLKVAVCDQVEVPRPGKLVARRVVRVLSAGTLIEDGFLSPGATARCVALWPDGDRVGLAALDVSTGDCQLATVAGPIGSSGVGYQLSALEAAELLLPESAEVPVGVPARAAVTCRPSEAFDSRRGAELVRAASAWAELPEADREREPALAALGALADYCSQGDLALDPRFLRLAWRRTGTTMSLDEATRRNLELTEATGGGLSLFRLIDRTLTPLGARRLRGWLLEPLSELAQLRERQLGVSELAKDDSLRAEVRAGLAPCRDLERLVGRCVHGAASPRDVGNLLQTLERIPQLVSALAGSSAPSLASISGRLTGVSGGQLSAHLRQALADELPAQARDGGFIRAGYDEELDRIREASAGARDYLSRLEEVERQRTGIKGLRVGYNRVFGYYIEVGNAGRDQIPAEYVRRQTLVGAERYVTPELREQEHAVLSSREQALARELDCLERLLTAAAAEVVALGQAAIALGDLDALQALAEVGTELGWVMPEVGDDLCLELVAGRHPLVEAGLGAGRFVPNDVVMDGETSRVWLLTGPNMAGKSTFLRQVALICLLGQVGSLVPCSRARWGLVDRIFTRIGAQDDLAAGRSTFMVEMEEMASILAQATPRSLLILDEIGRGTSTYDGMSIAQAILEYIHDRAGAARRVLFATHYHELTTLERSLPALRNFRVEVVETEVDGGAQITFLHQIVAGGADRSYGIHVAELAGLPRAVLERAGQVLAERESDRPLVPVLGPEQQLTLPLSPPHPVMVELERLQVDGMTPLEALQKIAEWQRQAGEGA
ncbi:MAG TPA: DNA mismatch repair protein MutS [Candidatus Dormibacteraeota bacterium]